VKTDLIVVIAQIWPFRLRINMQMHVSIEFSEI